MAASMLGGHVAVDGVAGLGPVQRDEADAALDFVLDIMAAHGRGVDVGAQPAAVSDERRDRVPRRDGAGQATRLPVLLRRTRWSGCTWRRCGSTRAAAAACGAGWDEELDTGEFRGRADRSVGADPAQALGSRSSALVGGVRSPRRRAPVPSGCRRCRSAAVGSAAAATARRDGVVGDGVGPRRGRCRLGGGSVAADAASVARPAAALGRDRARPLRRRARRGVSAASRRRCGDGSVSTSAGVVGWPLRGSVGRLPSAGAARGRRRWAAASGLGRSDLRAGGRRGGRGARRAGRRRLDAEQLGDLGHQPGEPL